jgi:hypothetical protein
MTTSASLFTGGGLWDVGVAGPAGSGSEPIAELDGGWQEL